MNTENGQFVWVLEQNGVKAIHLTLKCLYDYLEMHFDNLHEDDLEDEKFIVYQKFMTEKELDELPEFDGF